MSRYINIQNPVVSFPVDKVVTIEGNGIDYETNRLLSNIQENTRAATAPARLQNDEALMKRQLRREETYILSNPVCSSDRLEYIRDHINTLDVAKFEDLINDKFYDPAVMKEAICISNSLYYEAPGLVENNDRIREWIQNLKQIGEPSVEGYAIQGSLINTNIYQLQNNNLFVLKAPQNPNKDNLIHEMFIGYQLNKLRPYTPNFTMTYGGFKCTSPIIDSDKKIISWCLKTSSPVNFVLYENVNPSIPMGKYVSNIDVTTFLNLYLQVLFSLRLANKQLDYTHYDLHAENVLIRQINNSNDNFAIPYITENNKIEYLQTNRIATIIDYGFSHVKVNNNSYGFYNASPYGVYPDRSYIMYDAHKLLMWSIFRMRENGNPEYLKLEPLFRYFNKSNIFEESLNEESSTAFGFPLTNETKSLDLNDYIRYIRNVYPLVENFMSSRKPNTRILGCDGTDICITSPEIQAEIGLTDNLKVKTVFHFYDMVSRLDKENRDEAIEEIMDIFDVNMALDNALDEYDNLINDIAVRIQRLNPIDIGKTKLFNLINNRKLFDTMYYFTMEIIKIWDMIHRVYVVYDSIMYVLNWYKIDNGKQEIQNITNKLNTIFAQSIKRYNMIIDVFENNYNKIQMFYQKNPKMINTSIQNGNGITKWYFNVLPTYYTILSRSALYLKPTINI